MNGASNVGWDVSLPGDAENSGLGDDRMRSIKTSVAAGLNDEHNWPSADGSGFGYHLQGSARPYFGTQSRVSSSGTESRLMIASDTSQLFGVGSGGTNLIGGPRVISADSYPSGAAPGRYQFVESFGTTVTGAAGNVRVTFPNSGYSNPAVVFVAPFSQGTTVATVWVSESGTTNFVAMATVDGSGTSSALQVLGIAVLSWRAIGLRVL